MRPVMAAFFIDGVRFHRRCTIRLSAAERDVLSAAGTVTLWRPVEWPLAEKVPDFNRACPDPGGTDIWGPGPYLKVPNRRPGDDWEAVNRVFCPWGYPPDPLRVPWRSLRLTLAAVTLERASAHAWDWLLTVTRREAA